MNLKTSLGQLAYPPQVLHAAKKCDIFALFSTLVVTGALRFRSRAIGNLKLPPGAAMTVLRFATYTSPTPPLMLQENQKLEIWPRLSTTVDFKALSVVSEQSDI